MIGEFPGGGLIVVDGAGLDGVVEPLGAVVGLLEGSDGLLGVVSGELVGGVFC
ncbi:MAG: hypothetical protein ACRDTX_22785 [Pseudonocardiaceae bacterium]